MTMNTESKATVHEEALSVVALIQTRHQLKAAGEDLANIDQQIKPYKTIYIRAGAKYGGTYAGIVKWFNERAQTALKV